VILVSMTGSAMALEWEDAHCKAILQAWYPGAAGGKTGGNREFVPAMALAAKAFGANGYFFETHPDPEKAMSDGPNMLYLKDLETVIASLL